MIHVSYTTVSLKDEVFKTQEIKTLRVFNLFNCFDYLLVILKLSY